MRPTGTSAGARAAAWDQCTLGNHGHSVQHEPSPNFAFLAHHDARLVALGTQAEEHFEADPSVTLFKLRQFGEALAQRAAARVALFVDAQDGQQQLIDRLFDRNVIGATQRTIFHDLRRVGNAAVHEGTARSTTTPWRRSRGRRTVRSRQFAATGTSDSRTSPSPWIS